MSWIFGFVGTTVSDAMIQSFSSIHLQSLHLVKNDRLYLAAGGIPQTCKFGTFAPSDDSARQAGGWVVTGLGLGLNSERCRPYSETDWERELSVPSPHFEKLDGHFVALRWKNGTVEFYNDPLGQRTLFFYEMPHGVAFSTRLDWLTKLMNVPSLDYKAFGPRWLAYNQLTFDGLVVGTKRLPPGGSAKISPDGLSMKYKPWTPDSSISNDRSFESLVSAFINPEGIDDDDISFGLSGGLDSRFLLSFFLKNEKKVWIHSWGIPDHPDAEISRRIIKDEGIESRYQQFEEPIPSADECVRFLFEYESQSCMSEPASSMLKLRHFPKLYGQGKMLIDGGFGEIYRRIHHNLIVYRGKKELHSGDPKKLMPFLEVPRGAVFNWETTALMTEGFEHQLREVLQAMPPLTEYSDENFVELFAIRTRVPNWGSFEQSRLDSQVFNYMPLIQPALIRKLFEIPVSERRDGKLFRTLISKNTPSLARYPLVRGTTKHPFNLNAVEVFLYTKAVSKLGLGYSNPTVHIFLEHLKDFVLDTVHSSSVKSYQHYDHAAVTRTVEGYYAGRKELASQVDWWLSFEVWRQTLSVV